MNDRPSASWTNLTPDQWAEVQRSDHRSLFSREEVHAALSRLVPPEEVGRIVAELYDPDTPEPVFFFGDLLTVLSFGSPGAAERVRAVLNETETEAEARVHAFREAHPE